ncbi:MAG: metallopeptidase family protein [Phycisphaerales bacterium]|jgi:predicted Zn-dependent protease with MMP-like domain|nr:metallopeptidase family protein [Phycisphaerales bacterium]
MLDDDAREAFDVVFEEVLSHLPPTLHDLIERVPVIVEDQPAAEILAESDALPDEICGLHSGIPLTAQSVEDAGVLPETIHLYRIGILAAAERSRMGIREEIRITLLHEIGHHFGLDEQALEDSGYG